VRFPACEPVAGEADAQTADGQTRTLLRDATAITSEGTETRYVLFLLDITERK
jgi:PAS domain-containing protein